MNLENSAVEFFYNPIDEHSAYELITSYSKEELCDIFEDHVFCFEDDILQIIPMNITITVSKLSPSYILALCKLNVNIKQAIANLLKVHHDVVAFFLDKEGDYLDYPVSRTVDGIIYCIRDHRRAYTENFRTAIKEVVNELSESQIERISEAFIGTSRRQPLDEYIWLFCSRHETTNKDIERLKKYMMRNGFMANRVLESTLLSRELRLELLRETLSNHWIKKNLDCIPKDYMIDLAPFIKRMKLLKGIPS